MTNGFFLMINESFNLIKILFVFNAIQKGLILRLSIEKILSLKNDL